MKQNSIFYPAITRRSNYRKTANGSYYASYSEYKLEIREDCLGRCVYCDCHENETGGQEHMNLDHFKPKKYDKYKEIINDPNNLVWTCRGCNRLKSDIWPCLDSDETYKGKEGFVDPFISSYKTLFDVKEDGELLPLRDPADYMIKVLLLNRPSRKMVRKIRFLKYRIIACMDEKISELELRIEKKQAKKEACLASLESVVDHESMLYKTLLNDINSMTDDIEDFISDIEWLKSQKENLSKIFDFNLY